MTATAAKEKQKFWTEIKQYEDIKFQKSKKELPR